MAGIHNVLAGATSAFNYVIATNQTNLNLRTAALAAGWNGNTRLAVTINSGVYVSSNSTATPGLTVSGSFPSGVTLTNNGFIVGMGGAGGDGVSLVNEFITPATPGAVGGLALSVSSAITIDNTSGTIGGGGGGGGGSGGYVNTSEDPKSGTTYSYAYAGMGGGGGQTGVTDSAGGAAGIASGYFVDNSGNPGSPGTSAGPGAAGGFAPYGDGGTYGVYGGEGYSPIGEFEYPGREGGAPGGAITGNSNITWTNTGIRLGSIT